MTFRQAALKYMDDRAVGAPTANKIMEQVINDPVNAAMADRWDDDLSGYPEQMYTVIIGNLRHNAVKWIDANLPEAWFRSMFAPEDPQPV
jgi:hypothetical protein